MKEGGLAALIVFQLMHFLPKKVHQNAVILPNELLLLLGAT
jgi:hypothetical protein